MAEHEVNQDVNALRDDLKQLREDIATIAESLKKVVQGGARAVRANEPDDLYGQFKEGYESLRQEGKQARTVVEREIEERPFTALLGAFIVGIVLGKFMSVR
jgi:ElaB/YqjD/DUF883 family membrane-anchored ribosome-binding protein